MGALGEAALRYAEAGWAVVPLRPRGKAPACRGGSRAASRDLGTVRAWWEAGPSRNVGVACGAASGGLVVIDVDVDEATGEDGMATLSSWEAEFGALPETACAVTGRGGMHLYYRAADPVRNSACKELGIDVRGEGGFVVAPPSVHPSGALYEWAKPPWECPVAEADARVTEFLRFAQGKGSLPGSAAPGTGGGAARSVRFELPAVVGQGSRDDTLFRYAASLQARGLSDDEIADEVARANAERCMPPLPAADVRRIVASATRRYAKGSDAFAGAAAARGAGGRRALRKLDRNGNPTGPVLHNVVARELIETHRARLIDGAPAVWDGRRYETGWQAVNRAAIDLLDDCRIADQREICHYVLHKAPRVEAAPPNLVAFENGVLDVAMGELAPMGDAAIANVIPHAWDPDAYSAEADAFLDRVSCGDAAVRANLEEVAGLCLYRSNEFGVCPVLVGSGSNGKSTYIHALRSLLGNENVSSLDLGVVGRQFQAGRLLGKLANLGDDISNERLSGDVLAVFKKVVTGEWIYTDVKNGEGFEFRPYCTLVFSCNEFPSLGDSSDGMMRRLFPIPFSASFARGEAGFDPRMREKLCSEEASRYLARVGIEGLRRVIARDGMTPNARGEGLRAEVRADNDSTVQWLEERGEGAGALCGRVVADAYEEYKGWCADAGLRPFGRSKFTRRLCERYGLESGPARRRYSDGSRVVRVFSAGARSVADGCGRSGCVTDRGADA